MGKIVVSEFISLDGVMEGPGPQDGFAQAGWTMPYGNAEFMKYKLDELMAAEALLLGRVTYEGFAKAWPGQTDAAGFADKFNAMPKYVASTTLQTLDWNNSHLLEGDFKEAINSLKQQYDQSILVNGSQTLVNHLLKHKLVDELRLLVYPIVLGSGKKLFGDISAHCKLVDSQSFETGVVVLTYRQI